VRERHPDVAVEDLGAVRPAPEQPGRRGVDERAASRPARRVPVNSTDSAHARALVDRERDAVRGASLSAGARRCARSETPARGRHPSSAGTGLLLELVGAGVRERQVRAQRRKEHARPRARR
jgi:hypothetical protein